MQELELDIESKRRISKICWKHGVSPKHVMDRLLDVDDKTSLMNGYISDEILECAMLTWVELGMPDYAHGDDRPLSRTMDV